MEVYWYEKHKEEMNEGEDRDNKPFSLFTSQCSELVNSSAISLKKQES